MITLVILPLTSASKFHINFLIPVRNVDFNRSFNPPNLNGYLHSAINGKSFLDAGERYLEKSGWTRGRKGSYDKIV